MNLDRFVIRISRFRAISMIGVISSAIGAVLMFIIGAVKTIKAWVAFFPGGLNFTSGKTLEANVAIAYIAQAIDAFLIALVMMIFSSGIFTLFIQKPDPNLADSDDVLFKIREFGQLKAILAELVIIILFVKFLEVSLDNTDHFEWSMLVLPAGAVLLAASLKLLSLHSHE